MFPLFFDPTFFILIPAMLLAFYAQSRVKTTFQQYAAEQNIAGLTGAQAAEKLLNVNGLEDVRVEKAQDGLGDHYDPRGRVVRLSPSVYDTSSITSLGVASHEVGHAIQHSQGYVPLNLRNALVPVTRIGTTLAFPLLLLGLFASIPSLVKLGILAFLAVVIFQVITLPVEFNASSRALTLLESQGMVRPYEFKAIGSVLNAAALTYVAAAFMAVSNLARLLVLSGLTRDQD